MLNRTYIILLSLLMTMFVLGGCSSGGGDSAVNSVSTLVSGVAQKGPFQKGSLVTIYKVGDDYNVTSQKVVATVSDDSGHYSVNVPWSGLSKIVVTGKYSDELTGKVSDANVSLSSLLELKEGKLQANVNVLTDVASSKAITLLKKSKTSSYETVKGSVERDLHDAFDINASGVDIGSLDVTKLTGENALVNAKLLRLSGAILKSNNPQTMLLKLQNSFTENNSSSFAKNEDFQLLKLHEADVNVTELAHNIGVTQVGVTLGDIVASRAYADINASVDFKSTLSLSTGITQDKNVSILQNATKGSASSLLIGGENWDVKYAHTSCSVGADSFVYKTADGLGEVNIFIRTPNLVHITDINLSLLNTNALTNQTIMSSNGVVIELIGSALHGDANITLQNGNYLLSYQADSGFVGTETLQYKVTQDIQGCSFVQTGDINIRVSAKGFTYDDINITVPLQESLSFNAGLEADSEPTVVTLATNGDVNKSLVGGEFWYFNYQEKSCNAVDDQFVYETPTGFGRVNVLISQPTMPTLSDINVSVINSNTLSQSLVSKSADMNLSLTSSALHGDANLSLENGVYILRYKANSDYVGSDSISYTLTQIIKGCPFSVSANILINVYAKSFTYEDINITVPLKQSLEFATNLTQTDTISYPVLPVNGDVNETLVGNEFWYLTYNETVCSATEDQFVYESPSGFGRVNVTIVKTPFDAPDYNYTVKNTRVLTNIPLPGDSTNLVISKNPTHGTLSLTAIGGEGYAFTYDPVDTYEGMDSFEYALTQHISDCNFTKIGKVSIDVRGITPLVTTPTKANAIAFLSATQPQDKAGFGSSVAMNEDTIIVGEPSREYAHSRYNVGVVSIYKRTANEPELIQILKANYPEEYSETSHFGNGLSFHDGYLAVTSVSHADSTTVNRVSLYKQNVDKSFTFVQTIRQDTSRTNGEFAKWGVAVNKNIVVVGEGHLHDSTADMRAGLIKVYRKATTGWHITPTEITVDDNTTHNTLFGAQVVFMDDLIVVSAPYYTTDVNGTATMTGEIFVYKDNNSSLDLVQTLAVPKELQVDYGLFGYKLSTDGNYLSVGSEQASVNGMNGAGRVYVYSQDGDSLVQIASVTDENPKSDGHFGKTVALSGKYLAVASDTTATSGFTDSRGYTHLYQYSGDNNYTRIGLFDAKKLAKELPLNYQEYTGFGFGLAMSGSQVVSSAPGGFAYTSLGTKSTQAGRLYLLDCDTSVASIVDYQKEIKMAEGFVRLNGIYTQTTDASFALSGVDASLFNVNKGYYGKYNALNTALSYASPQDSNNDNIYDFTIDISDNGIVKSYPMSLEIYKSYTINASENAKEPSYNINNLYPLDSGGSSMVTSSSEFAKEVVVDSTKVYASSKDKLYIFDKKVWNSTDKELIDLVANHIDYPDSSSHPYTHANLARFALNGTEIAFDAYTENDKNDTNQTVYIYSATDLSLPQQKIEFYESSKDGLFPHKDMDRKHIQTVALDNGHLFVQYNKEFIHDDANNSKDVTINMIDIDIYTYTDANQSFDYNQTLEVPRYRSDLNSSSIDDYISVKNGFLAFSYRKNDAGEKTVALYKYDLSTKEYKSFQSIDMNTSDYVHISLEDGNHLVVQKVRYDDYEYNDIYALNANATAFELIDSISPLEAGATHNIKDGIYYYVGIAKISGDNLIMKIRKRLEEDDFHPYSSGATIGDSNYIALFRWDATTQRYVFANSFTKVNGSDTFGVNYAISANSVVTSGDGSMNMFEFVPK